MGKPAARIGDMHICPMVDGLKPHVGGPVAGPGVPTVLIGGMPAAVMGDMCTCVGPPDAIILGSTGVLIGGKPAARMGDQCAHGGAITLGCLTVLIGETMAGGGDTSTALKNVLSNNAIKKAMKQSAVFTTNISRLHALLNGADKGEETVHKHNEEDCKVQYKIKGEDGKPAKDLNYEIHTSDAKIIKGITDDKGMTQQILGYTEGMCKIIFPG